MPRPVARWQGAKPDAGREKAGGWEKEVFPVGVAWAEAEKLTVFGEEPMALKVVAQEGATLLGPSLTRSLQEMCSASGPGGGKLRGLPVAGCW